MCRPAVLGLALAMFHDRTGPVNADIVNERVIVRSRMMTNRMKTVA